MSYETVLEQVRAAPEACLDEISSIIRYVVYRYQQDVEEDIQPSAQLAAAMQEALQICDDSSVEGYTDLNVLFANLNT